MLDNYFGSQSQYDTTQVGFCFQNSGWWGGGKHIEKRALFIVLVLFCFLSFYLVCSLILKALDLLNNHIVIT